jgi:hypothetical protein
LYSEKALRVQLEITVVKRKKRQAWTLWKGQGELRDSLSEFGRTLEVKLKGTTDKLPGEDRSYDAEG